MCSSIVPNIYGVAELKIIHSNDLLALFEGLGIDFVKQEAEVALDCGVLYGITKVWATFRKPILGDRVWRSAWAIDRCHETLLTIQAALEKRFGHVFAYENARDEEGASVFHFGCLNCSHQIGLIDLGRNRLPTMQRIIIILCPTYRTALNSQCRANLSDLEEQVRDILGIGVLLKKESATIKQDDQWLDCTGSRYRYGPYFCRGLERLSDEVYLRMNYKPPEGWSESVSISTAKAIQKKIKSLREAGYKTSIKLSYDPASGLYSCDFRFLPPWQKNLQAGGSELRWYGTPFCAQSIFEAVENCAAYIHQITAFKVEP